mgnify:CR=1 FL=1
MHSPSRAEPLSLFSEIALGQRAVYSRLHRHEPQTQSRRLRRHTSGRSRLWDGVRRKDRELLRTFEPIVEFKRTPEHISDNGAVQHNEISDSPGLFKRLNEALFPNAETANKSNYDASAQVYRGSLDETKRRIAG